MTHVPPRVKLPMRFNQDLWPPFDVAMMPDGLCLEGITNLTDAVHEFVRYCLPPIDGRTAMITDTNGVIALGYHHDPFADEPLRWFGTFWGVRSLRNHPLVEPALMVAIEMALEPEPL